MDHVDPVRWCLVVIAPRARCRTGPGTTEQGTMMSETKADKATRPVRFDWERGLLASALPFEVKAVGLALATYAGRSGELWPSNDTVARNMSASKRTIQRHSKSLRQSGWIAKSNKPGSSGTNRLRLTIPPSAPAGVADAALDRACDAGADPEGGDTGDGRGDTSDGTSDTGVVKLRHGCHPNRSEKRSSSLPCITWGI